MEATIEMDAAEVYEDTVDVDWAKRKLKVSAPTVLRMARDGLMTSIRPTFGRKLLFPRSEIERLQRESIVWRKA